MISMFSAGALARRKVTSDAIDASVARFPGTNKDIGGSGRLRPALPGSDELDVMMQRAFANHFHQGFSVVRPPAD